MTTSSAISSDTGSAALVYSTSTGQEPTGPLAVEPEFDMHAAPTFEWPAFCFVCSRVTDHETEHGDLKAAGLIVIDEKGSVHKAAAWTDEAAAAVRHATDVANGWA